MITAERFVELETRLAFLEKLLDDLNGVLATQQQQLDRLEQETTRLARQFQAPPPVPPRSRSGGACPV